MNNENINNIFNTIKVLEDSIRKELDAKSRDVSLLSIHDLSKCIETRRKDMNLTLTELSDYSGVALGTVHKAESGNLKMNLNNLKSILDVLGVEICLKKK